jgi:hypothetical protein
MPGDKDGASFLPILEGKRESVPPHDPVLFCSWIGPSVLSADGYKLRRVEQTDSFQLFHLPTDPSEGRNIAVDHSEMVTELSGIMLRECGGDYRDGNPNAHLIQYADPRFAQLSPMAGQGLLFTP